MSGNPKLQKKIVMLCPQPSIAASQADESRQARGEDSQLNGDGPKAGPLLTQDILSGSSQFFLSRFLCYNFLKDMFIRLEVQEISRGLDCLSNPPSPFVFFQTDKDLVYDFVKEGGLTLLIELGEDEEAQLQK